MTEKTPLIIRTLPGFHAVEDACLLHGDDRVEKEADIFIEKHFGILVEDLNFARIDDGTSIDLDDLDAERAAHPARLLVDFMYEEDIVPYLLGLGADLRMEHGPPLRCARVLAPAVEAAIRGIAGHMPEASAINVEGFENWLTKEARAFQGSKSNRGRAGNR